MWYDEFYGLFSMGLMSFMYERDMVAEIFTGFFVRQITMSVRFKFVPLYSERSTMRTSNN